ncbi:MAG: C40 family peptidase [Ignavibacteria bacterium]
MRKVLLFLFLVFFIAACYGPVRFATKSSNNTQNLYVDSIRIKRALTVQQSDTTQRFATDLEFTEDELQEIILEDQSKPIRDMTEILVRRGNLDTLNSNPTYYEKFLMTVINYLGTPYKFGGTTRRGIDCSAFTQLIFQESLNIEIPRSTLQQIKIGKPVSREELQFGDLVFFNTRRRQNPGHVGIYLWDNYFVHASTKYGVIVSSMADGYYDRRFVGARRIEELYALTNGN